MPRLPTAEDLGERPVPRANTRELPVQSRSPQGEAMQYAGRRVSALGEEIQQIQMAEEDRADTLRAEDAQNALVSKSLELAEGDDGFRKKPDSAAANESLVADYWRRYEQSAKEIEANLGNDRQREKFRRRATVLGIQYRQDLLRDTSAKGERHAAAVYKNTLAVESENVASHWNDPNAVGASVERLNASINERARSQNWDDDTIALERSHALGGLHTSAVVSALDNDNYAYAKSYFDKVSPEIDEGTRHKLSSALNGKRREMDAEARQQQVLARVELSEIASDVEAASRAGLRYEGDIPTRAEFAVYGDKADERYANFQKVLAAGKDTQDAALADPAGQAAILARYTPDPTRGFRGNQEVYEIVRGNIAQLNKEREDDPGRYVLRLPKVADAYRQMAAAPDDQDAAQEYVRQVQAASADLGIQNQAVLPKAYADQFVSQFYDQKSGGEPAALRILGEKEKWGDQWPAVWQQIAPDLPGSAFVIGMGMNPEAGRRLAEVSGIDQQTGKPITLATLRDQLPDDTPPGDLTKAVRSSLNDAVLSYAGQPGSDKLASNLLDSAERLAIRYRASGKGVSDAAEQAAGEVFNERYEFIERDDATIRVPRQYDADVMKGALRVVTSTLSDQPGINESQWQTLPDDSGVALTWMGGLVEGPDGQPIAYTWDELKNRVATNAYAVEAQRNLTRGVK